MNSHYDGFGEAGLQFFGKVSASIAHEIKNALAVINENVGLLEDFTLLAQRGVEMDPQRLQGLAQSLFKQVNRADTIIKNMSQFAHSVDDFEKSIDLNDLLELVAALSQRTTAMRGVALETVRAGTPVTLTTNPFLLENLVWLCLEFITVSAGTAKTVVLAADNINSGVCIKMSGLENIADTATDDFPTAQIDDMAAALGAEIRTDMEKKELILVFPKNIPM